MRLLAVIAALTLAACQVSIEHTPRLATQAEAGAILKSLAMPLDGFCISNEIAAPLASYRRNQAEWRGMRPWYSKFLDVFEPIAGKTDDEWGAWVEAGPLLDPADIPRDKRLELDRTVKLAEKIEDAGFTPPAATAILPAKLVEKPGANDELPCGEAVGHETGFSWPVIVGGVALVEPSEFCGGLCGQGNLVALELKDRKWRAAARTVTWMA